MSARAEGPECLPEGLEGLPEGPEDLPEGPEGLRAYQERQGWTDGRMDGRKDGIIPHSVQKPSNIKLSLSFCPRRNLQFRGGL